MSYQEIVGSIMANSHPGSYCGQDAYNDMFVTEKNRNGLEYRERTSTRCGEFEREHQQNAELYVRSNEDFEGGCDEMDTIVRRLTPKECERLQGFPDGWTDLGEWTDSKGKKHQTADSARYKALGNSIAVGYANNCSGFWMWVMKRISAQYSRNATLGSLFDGIGGFPLAWETYNGKGSAVWASEIEEFCIAVTKKRFPEEES